MAQTTTDINACDVSVWLDDDAGTLKDISGSSNSVSLSFTQNIGSKNTFQSKWPRRLSCGKDATVTLVAVYSTAADEAFDILKTWYFSTSPGLRTLKVYIPDKNVGSDMYSGEFTLQSLEWTNEAGVADPITVTAVLLPSGEVSHSTAAT